FGGHACVSAFDHGAQHGLVDVGELGDVQTAAANLVLAELLEQSGGIFVVDDVVDHQTRLAWRQADLARVAFATAVVFVVIGAEADNGVAPHDGSVAGGVSDQFGCDFGVSAARCVGDGGDKGGDAGFVGHGFIGGLPC